MLCDQNRIEDEFHVIMHCNLYYDIRYSLLETLYGIDPNLQHKPLEDVFVFIMSDRRIARQSAKACLNILNRRQSFIP